MSEFWTQFIASHPSSSQDLTQGLFPITDQQLLMVEGPDSSKFMQGQFTCNMSEITENSFRRGACCNPKGRMIASFTLVNSAENQYIMSVADGMAEVTQNHLKKYMVFFKTEMTSSDWVLAGLRGEGAAETIAQIFGSVPSEDYGQVQSEQGLALKLPFNAGYELWLKADTAQSTLETVAQSLPLQPAGLWQNILISSGLAQVTPEASEEHIPQMMNLGQTGGISFSKGCYTGQEIVARMQYLGKLKRHLYRIAFTADQAPSSHTGIHVQGKDSAVGNLVNITTQATSSQSNHFEALAVLEDKQLDQFSNLYIEGCNDLELLDLPYEVVPAEE